MTEKSVVGTKQHPAFRRNVKWQFIGSAGQAILGGFLLLLMGKELGAIGFGQFSIIMGFVYVANFFFEPRMQDVAAKQFTEFDSDDATKLKYSHYLVDLFAVESIGKLLPCVSLVLLAPLLTEIGNLPSEHANLIIIASLGIYLARIGNGLSIGILRVLGRSDLYAFCVTGEQGLRLLLTLALVWNSEVTVIGCIVVLCFSGIVSNTVQWILVAKHFQGNGNPLKLWNRSAAFARLRENQRLLFSNLGLSISDLMNKDLDITLIAPLLGADQVGIYKMTKSIVTLTWRAVDPFYLALMPELVRLMSRDDFAGVKQVLKWSLIGLLGLAVSLAFFSYEFMAFFGHLILGPEFSEVPSLMLWMLIGIVISAPLVWGHPLSVALHRPDVAFAGSLLGSVVGLIAFQVWTQRFGMYGAGLSWSLTFMTNFVATSSMSYAIFCGRLRCHLKK